MQLVILDRDGVIKAASGAARAHEWQTVPGSLEALARLCGAGYRLVITAHQSSPRRKTLNIETQISVHHRLQQELLEAGSAADAVFFCACPPEVDCDCQMPNPGMLLDIAARLRISLEGVPVIGSSMAVVDAALSGGARPLFVRSGARGEIKMAESRVDLECYDDLAAAVDALLAESQPA